MRDAPAVSDPIVFLSVNGIEERIPISQARVPVLDRGFIFGDGIYEVVPVYDRVPFRLEHHLARLRRSLAAIGIDNPYDDAGWRGRIAALIESSGLTDQMVYMQVTRGVARRAHAFPSGTVPTVFMMSNPLVLPTAAAREQGVAVVSANDNRWLRCDIKSVSLLGNVLMAQNAAEHGVAETIMFRDGYLSEASSSNVWIVKDGALYAPTRNERILEGIRYGLLAELATAHELAFFEQPISRAEVRAADEVMLSSATKEVLAVVSIDGEPVGNGQVGPVAKRLLQWYQEAKQATRKQYLEAAHAAAA
jgi:D-alanine transaminase